MSSTVKSTTKPFVSGQVLVSSAAELLRRALGFCDCSDETRETLLAIGQLRSVRRGEYLSRQGLRGQHLGMLIAGLANSSVLHADGHRHLLGLLLPGDFYGLINMLDASHYNGHDVVMRDEGAVLVVPREAFREMRRKELSLVRACEAQLAHRLHLVYERLAVDPAMPLTTRVANMLQMLGRLYGHADGEQIEIDVHLSQTDMADWLGLSRQRVNFALKQLEAEGLIRLHYSSLIILSAKGLATRASG